MRHDKASPLSRSVIPEKGLQEGAHDRQGSHWGNAGVTQLRGSERYPSLRYGTLKAAYFKELYWSDARSCYGVLCAVPQISLTTDQKVGSSNLPGRANFFSIITAR